MGFLKDLGFDTIFDLLGFVTQIIYNLTPILYNMNLEYGTFKIQNVSIISVFCLYINAFIYFFLNLFSDDVNENTLVIRDYCNLIGTFLGFVYLVIYYYERYKDEDIKKIILNYLLILAVSGIIIAFEYLFIIKENNRIASYLFKWLGVIPNVFEYFPIGVNIIYLIRNKISENLSLIGATLGLINSIVWFIWAIQFTLKNIDEPQYHSMIANFLAIFLNVLQYYVFCRYKSNNNENYYSFGKAKLD
jgi:hypothetical protein